PAGRPRADGNGSHRRACGRVAADGGRGRRHVPPVPDGVVCLVGGGAGCQSTGSAAFLQVTLVVFLRPVEGGQRLDRGDDGGCQPGLLRGAAGHGLGPLLFVVDEDDGAVLTADIGALAIGSGGIVIVPEHVQQV